MSTLFITKAMNAAYAAFLNTSIDSDLAGNPILRRTTYPYSQLGEGCDMVAFGHGYQVGQKSTPVLMTADNRLGWKLEELAPQLVGEVEAKTEKIKDDPRAEAQQVLANNQKIIGHLQEIQRLQTESYQIMSALGPDLGPAGKPRIGGAA